MQVKIQKIKERDEWTIKVLDDEGKQIGSLTIQRWSNVKEDIETWNQNFMVHIHNWKGKFQIRGEDKTDFVSVYPAS